MSLPHAEHQSDLSIEELINTVLNGEKPEIEIAASMWISDEDDISLTEICDEAYDKYFETKAEEISKVLGQCLYKGSLPDPDAWKWDETLGLNAGFSTVAVWPKSDRYIYMQLVLEENVKVVALGVH